MAAQFSQHYVHILTVWDSWPVLFFDGMYREGADGPRGVRDERGVHCLQCWGMILVPSLNYDHTQVAWPLRALLFALNDRGNNLLFYLAGLL